MNGWANFLIAEVGASATLAGLIFVGVSFNLTKILSYTALTNRALQALMFLVAILVLSSLLLVPEQPFVLIGVEVLGIGVVLWVATLRLNKENSQKTDPQYSALIRRSHTLNQIVILPYIVTGIAVMIWGALGLYGLAVIVILAFGKAISDAWVLLVEIKR